MILKLLTQIEKQYIYITHLASYLHPSFLAGLRGVDILFFVLQNYFTLEQRQNQRRGLTSLRPPTTPHFVLLNKWIFQKHQQKRTCEPLPLPYSSAKSAALTTLEPHFRSFYPHPPPLDEYPPFLPHPSKIAIEI